MNEDLGKARFDNIFSRSTGNTGNGEDFSLQSGEGIRRRESPAERPSGETVKTTGVARYPSNVMGEGRHSNDPAQTYRRSDREILDELARLLASDDTIDSSKIEVSVSEGRVFLRGQVDSEYTSELVKDLAAGLMDVEHVVNKLQLAEAPLGHTAQITGQKGLKGSLSR